MSRYVVGLLALVLVACEDEPTGPPVPTSIDIEIVEQVPDSVCAVWRFAAGTPAVCANWVVEP